MNHRNLPSFDGLIAELGKLANIALFKLKINRVFKWITEHLRSTAVTVNQFLQLSESYLYSFNRLAVRVTSTGKTEIVLFLFGSKIVKLVLAVFQPLENLDYQIIPALPLNWKQILSGNSSSKYANRIGNTTCGYVEPIEDAPQAATIANLCARF